MRRELIFSIAGFLAGFALAAAVFFQPSGEQSASNPTPSQPAPAAAAVASTPQPAFDPGRIGRPIVIEDEEPAKAASDAAEGKSPATLLHETIARLPNLSEKDRDAAVNELIASLRKQGPAGLKAVREYLKNGQDVKIRNGWGMSNGKITSSPSLRVALIDALSDWPEATDVNLEVLRGAPRAFEAALAARNLEMASPGAYRADVIRAMSVLANQPMRGDFAAEGINYIFDAMSHFNAPELLPAAEKIVASQPWTAFQLMNALKDMPPDVRNPAYGRLFANPKIAEQLASNPHVLRNLAYADPLVAQNAAQLYANGMDGKQRDRFLADFGSNRSFAFRNDFFAPQSGQRVATVVDNGRGPENSELTSRLAFLDQIAPYSTTPVLQQRLEEARTDLKEALANPRAALDRPVEIQGARFIEFGGGGGNLKIKGDAIQTIEIKQK